MTTTPPLPAAVNLLTLFNSTPTLLPQQQAQSQPQQKRKPSPSPNTIFHIPSWPMTLKKPPRRFTFATKHVITGGEIMEPNVDMFHGRWGRQPSVELHLPIHVATPIAASPIPSYANMIPPMISPLNLAATPTTIAPPSTCVIHMPESPCDQVVTIKHETTAAPPTTPTMRAITAPPPTPTTSITAPLTTPTPTPMTTRAKTKSASFAFPLPTPPPTQRKKHKRMHTISITPSRQETRDTAQQPSRRPSNVHCLCLVSPCHHVIDIPSSTYMYPSPTYSELSPYRSTTCSPSTTPSTTIRYSSSHTPYSRHPSDTPSHNRFPSQYHSHFRVPSYCHFESPSHQTVSTF